MLSSVSCDWRMMSLNASFSNACRETADKPSNCCGFSIIVLPPGRINAFLGSQKILLRMTCNAFPEVCPVVYPFLLTQPVFSCDASLDNFCGIIAHHDSISEVKSVPQYRHLFAAGFTNSAHVLHCFIISFFKARVSNTL